MGTELVSTTMIAEAMEVFDEKMQRKLEEITLYEDDKQVVKLVSRGSDMPSVERFDKQQPVRIGLHVADIQSLARALDKYEDNRIPAKEDHEKTAHFITVSSARVFVDMEQPSRHERTLEMAMVYSEPFGALTKANHWLSQQEFYQLLCTSLDGHLPESLAATVSKIRVRKTDDSRIEIDQLGVGRAQAEQKIEVTFPGLKSEGDTTEELPVWYEYKGPVYQCANDEVEYVIKLRLEALVDEGRLNFRFVPVKLDLQLIWCRDDIATEIAKLLTADSTVVIA